MQQLDLPIWCRITVPHRYHAQPVLSRLTSQYRLRVAITAATLGYESVSTGWFDLVWLGQPHQQLAGLRYLQSLDIKIQQFGPTTGWRKALAISGAPMSLLPDAVPSSTTPTTEPRSFCLGQSSTGPGQLLTCVELQIPRVYQAHPLLSDMVLRYRVTINIVTALLKAEQPSDGRFELAISGAQQNVQACLKHLHHLELVV